MTTVRKESIEILTQFLGDARSIYFNIPEVYPNYPPIIELVFKTLEEIIRTDKLFVDLFKDAGLSLQIDIHGDQAIMTIQNINTNEMMVINNLAFSRPNLDHYLQTVKELNKFEFWFGLAGIDIVPQAVDTKASKLPFKILLIKN